MWGQSAAVPVMAKGSVCSGLKSAGSFLKA